MYKNYGLYLPKHFVVALTNVCTVKLGAAALIDTFSIGTGDDMACQSKIAPHSGKTFFILHDNSFTELLESNLKIWEKRDTFNSSEHTSRFIQRVAEVTPFLLFELSRFCLTSSLF